MSAPARLLSVQPAYGEDGAMLLDVSVRLEVPFTEQELTDLQAVIAATFATPELMDILQGMELSAAAALAAGP